MNLISVSSFKTIFEYASGYKAMSDLHVLISDLLHNRSMDDAILYKKRSASLVNLDDQLIQKYYRFATGQLIENDFKEPSKIYEAHADEVKRTVLSHQHELIKNNKMPNLDTFIKIYGIEKIHQAAFWIKNIQEKEIRQDVTQVAKSTFCSFSFYATVFYLT